MTDQFVETVTELFKEAGVPIDDSTKADFDQCVLILWTRMSGLSLKYGLSYERVEKYDAQKKALVEDLRAKYHKSVPQINRDYLASPTEAVLEEP